MTQCQSGIYEIVNTVTGKRYVGSAVNFTKRWTEHRAQLSSGKHHSRHLQAAWAKHGRDAFEFRKLLICEKENLLTYEQILMDGMNPEYNVLKVAGSSLGRKATEETRKRIAQKAIGRIRSRESVERGAAKRRGVPLAPEHAAKLIGNKHAAGSVHSPERKKAISEFMMGRSRPKSEEHRAKLSAALTGRKASQESRANQSAAQLGTKRGPYDISDAERQARSERMKSRAPLTLGRKRPEHEVEKIAARNRGRKESAERIQQKSVAAKAMWDTPEIRAKILASRAETIARRKASK